MKIFWFDTETTGLDPVDNSIVQLAAIVEIDGEIAEEREFLIKPPDQIEWNDKASEVTGYTKENTADHPIEPLQYQAIKRMLKRYVDPYNRADKFFAGGYNVRFDMDMLSGMWDRYDDHYFRSWFYPTPLDVMGIAAIAAYRGYFPSSLPSHKLGDIIEHVGVETPEDEALHDAMTDIRLTRACAIKLLEGL
jgi:DNA polymerase III epsilon subunit-like protein